MTKLALFVLIASAIGIVIMSFAIKVSRGERKQGVYIMTLAGQIILFLLSAWLVIDGNSLLWAGQHRSNGQIEFNDSSNSVEKSSILYVFRSISNDVTPSDIERSFGTNYTSEETDRYYMRYSELNFTLKNYYPDSIVFKFNQKKNKILSVSWIMRTNPNHNYYDELSSYLIDTVLGAPKSTGINEIDWKGIHFSVGSYVIFERVF